MNEALANVKCLESRINCDGSASDRMAVAEEEFQKVCRTCLRETNANNLENFLLPQLTIREILEESTGLKIEPTDCLPNHVCNECLKRIKTIYKFRWQCLQLDEALRDLLTRIEPKPIEEPIDGPHIIPVVVGKVDNRADSTIQYDQFQVTYLDETGDTTKAADMEVESEQTEHSSTTEKKKLFRCGICLREFTFRNGLHDHIQLAHVQKKEMYCQNCGRKFRTKARLLLHKKRNCAPANSSLTLVEREPWQADITIKGDEIEITHFQCSICDESIELEKDFLTHLQTHWNVKTCKHCNKKVNRPSHLESHVRSHSKFRPYVCPYCSKAFSATQSLRCHLQTYSQRQAQTCQKCDIVFCSLKDYLKHYNEHLLNGEIVLDGNIDPKEAADKSKTTDSNNSSKAAGETGEEQKDDLVSTVVTVKQEKLDEEPLPVKEEQTIKIVNEPLTEDDQEEQKLPVLTAIAIKDEPEDIQEVEESEHIEYVMPSVTVAQHTDQPTNKVPNEDDDDFFKTGVDGNSQNERIKYGSFNCPDATCQMEYKYYRDIVNHYMTGHTTNPPFMCTVCKMQCQHKTQLRVHLKKHIKCVFKCPFCHRPYGAFRDLKNHLRTHTGERPFQCTICRQRFKQKAALRVHMQTHNTNKEYKCRYCSKEFFSYNGMFLHQKSHIKIEELQCKACKKQFPTQSRLKRHLTTVCGLVMPTLLTGKD